MASDNIADILTTDGWELLNSLGPYTEADSLRLTGQLRKAGYSPEVVAAALTQSRLRAKASISLKVSTLRAKAASSMGSSSP